MKQSKKFFLIGICLLLFLTFAYASTTTYMSCGGVKGIPYDIPGVVRFFINLIKIFVPIILILMGSIDFAKVVISNDDKEMKKATGKFVKRVIAAVAVFFVIFLVQLLISLIGTNTSGVMECIACFTSDSSKCSTYEVEMEDYSDEKAQADKEREELEAEREENRKENEEDSGNAGKDLDIDSGMTLRTYSSGSKSMKYWELVPDNPKTNMPLVIFLHGSEECGSPNNMLNVSFSKYMNDGEFDEHDAFFIAPNTSSDWVSTQATLMELIESVVEEYDIDKSRISITGHSLGAIGVWNIVSNYPTYFSAAVPISYCDSVSASNFKTTPVRAYAGSSESNYECMNSLVTQIKNQGGDAEFEWVQGTNHSTVVQIYKTTDII